MLFEDLFSDFEIFPTFSDFWGFFFSNFEIFRIFFGFLLFFGFFRNCFQVFGIFFQTFSRVYEYFFSCEPLAF